MAAELFPEFSVVATAACCLEHMVSPAVPWPRFPRRPQSPPGSPHRTPGGPQSRPVDFHGRTAPGGGSSSTPPLGSRRRPQIHDSTRELPRPPKSPPLEGSHLCSWLCPPPPPPPGPATTKVKLIPLAQGKGTAGLGTGTHACGPRGGRPRREDGGLRLAQASRKTVSPARAQPGRVPLPPHPADLGAPPPLPGAKPGPRGVWSPGSAPPPLGMQPWKALGTGAP
ncbi:proline-rich protein HaeIII subfamily 1-like [Perognathus longimembris pacificus]|uniref:proline-rich protein HaeIII subfamily 1-like n=1 Tax=Perognathus longimembris pacificus TaxID=214514 RepID=UPI0020195E5A|nr:proline-rich protein HaeIII subfamily 1-like [Perognathus longimembris pacificus]